MEGHSLSTLNDSVALTKTLLTGALKPSEKEKLWLCVSLGGSGILPDNWGVSLGGSGRLLLLAAGVCGSGVVTTGVFTIDVGTIGVDTGGVEKEGVVVVGGVIAIVVGPGVATGPMVGVDIVVVVVGAEGGCGGGGGGGNGGDWAATGGIGVTAA